MSSAIVTAVVGFVDACFLFFFCTLLKNESNKPVDFEALTIWLLYQHFEKVLTLDLIRKHNLITKQNQSIDVSKWSILEDGRNWVRIRQKSKRNVEGWNHRNRIFSVCVGGVSSVLRGGSDMGCRGSSSFDRSFTFIVHCFSKIVDRKSQNWSSVSGMIPI